MRGVDRSLLASALAIWAGCGAVMGIGMSVSTETNAHIVHLFAAPAIAFVVAFVYFARTGSDRLAFTALAFMAIPALVDLVLVAVVLMRSLVMFSSLIGTWIPLGLILVATYLAGRVVAARRPQPARAGAAG